LRPRRSSFLTSGESITSWSCPRVSPTEVRTSSRWSRCHVLPLEADGDAAGMENPIFTLATPTVISGDRQNVDVIAHEQSHSWSGNLVTSCSWELLLVFTESPGPKNKHKQTPTKYSWLNEGWTTYL